MAAIDVGSAAIDRASGASSANTYLDYNNPANAAGAITTVEVWFKYSCTAFHVGTFYPTTGTNFKCRDFEDLGAGAAGSKQTYSGLAISVQTGDYIAEFAEGGQVERDLSGYGGVYYYGGNQLSVDNEQTYTFAAGDCLSLYGTGSTGIQVTPTAAASLAAGVNPTTVLGSLTLSPTAAASPAASVAPVVVAGSITVTPGAAAVLAAGVDPTLEFTSTSAEPAASEALAAVLGPTVVLGSLSLSPAAAPTLAASMPPTVLIATIVTPAAAAILAATLAPWVFKWNASPTLTAAQKKATLHTLIRAVLTHGATTHTYYRDRILACDQELEPYTQTAALVLDNSDGQLSDLDLKGYKAVVSFGLKTSEGDEYALTPPMWVTDQQFDSSEGELVCTLTLEGIPDRLGRDRASEVYAPTDSDVKTVKTLIGEILGATITCYNHCQAYTVVWDSEDSLIDTYQPRDTFRIYLNSTRLAVLRRLLDLTKCVMRAEMDGKVHIFQPVISGAAYEYDYSLAKGEHTFFSKAYRNKLVMPNYVQVSTPANAANPYSGYATDADSVAAIGEIRHYVKAYLTSDAQATGVAGAIVSKYQLHTSSGKAQVPLNVGARVFDYVQVTDARQDDQRSGNIGYLARHYSSGKKKRIRSWSMSFAFGGWLSMQKLLNNLQLASDLSYDFLRLHVKNLVAEKIQAEDIDVDTLSAICAYLGEVSVAGGDVMLGSYGIKVYGERLKFYRESDHVGSIYTSPTWLKIAAWGAYGLDIFTEVGEGQDIDIDADGDLDLIAGGTINIKDAAETDHLDAATSLKDIGATSKYDEIHCNDLYGTTHCYDEHDDLALVKAMRPCDDNPRLIATPSLPDFLRPSKDYALAKMDRNLQERGARHRAVIAQRIEREADPARLRRLQAALRAVGRDHQDKLHAFEQHYDADLAGEASVTRTAFFALGALKQAALKLDAIEARIAALEGRPR